MNTSQGGTVSALLYLVVYAACLPPVYRRAGGLVPLLRRLPPAAGVLWLAVAVPSLLEFAWPAVYDALSRQPDLIADGQVWRLVTSAVVQDGGLPGTVYNLATLALTIPAAVAVWGLGRTVGLFLAGALIFNLSATFAWPAAGGGNSAATFFVVTSLAAALALRDRTPQSYASAAVVAAVGAVLVWLADAHGIAVLTGLGAGLLVAGSAIRGRPGPR